MEGRILREEAHQAKERHTLRRKLAFCREAHSMCSGGHMESEGAFYCEVFA